MGFPPPPDYPVPPPDSLAQQATAPLPPAPPPVEVPGIGLAFETQTPPALLCGFGIPTFGLSLSLPSFSLGFAFPPPLSFGLALNCDLSNPISAKFGFGGGRAPNADPDVFDSA